MPLYFFGLSDFRGETPLYKTNGDNAASPVGCQSLKDSHFPCFPVYGMPYIEWLVQNAFWVIQAIVLLDSGVDANFIDKTLANKLKLDA